MAGEQQRVVIIGSGFGGLFATRELAKAPVDITLIDRTPQHLFQPLLYQVATGILSEGEIAPPTRNILKKQKNAHTVLGEVVDIDVAARTVTSVAVGIETVTPYDTLIVAAGAQTTYFGNDHFVEYATGLKSIDDALELRGKIFNSFELAEIEPDPAKREEWMTFVVVGAGPTGVEMAGQIAELAHRSLVGNFRNIDTTKARVVLIDGADAPLATFGAKLSAGAAKALEHLGVEVWLGNFVSDMGPEWIEIKDKSGHVSRINARTKVWSAGVSASPLAKMLADQVGVSLARGGRIPVQPDLTLKGHPETFVVGDMIALNNLPGVSPVAIQTGKFAADQIKRRLARKETGQAFEYFDKGSMATVSRFNAVVSIGPIRLSGFLAWVTWLVVHLFYLVGFKNRLTTIFHWGVSFIGSDRAERTPSHEHVLGRASSRALGVSGLDVPRGQNTATVEELLSDAPSES